jgi:hypothetical protein
METDPAETSDRYVGRRHVLTTASASATGAIAGCGARDGNDHSPTLQSPDSPTQQRDSSASAGDVTTVFYDPNGSTYETVQDALDAVPQGGTLLLGTGEIDVAEEGRILVERGGITIRGEGWTETGSGADRRWPGTQIVNRGDDAVDRPAVEFAAPEGRLAGGTLATVSVDHGGDSPAVRIRSAIHTRIADCRIFGRGQAPIGVSYEGASFFARMYRCVISGIAAEGRGILVNGIGYAYEFYSNYVGCAGPDSIALETRSNRTIVVGGEYAATADGGTAIRFYNEKPYPRYGGLVLEPGIEETGTQIEIDGEGPFQGVQVYHMGIPATSQLEHPDDPIIHFGNAENAKIIFPVVQTEKGGESITDYNFAHWSSQADHCGILTDAKTLERCEYTDDGATGPYVSVAGSAADEAIAAMPTGVPTTVEYGASAGAPLYHDGQSWIRLAGQQYEPAP